MSYLLLLETLINHFLVVVEAKHLFMILLAVYLPMAIQYSDLLCQSTSLTWLWYTFP